MLGKPIILNHTIGSKIGRLNIIWFKTKPKVHNDKIHDLVFVKCTEKKRNITLALTLLQARKDSPEERKLI